MGVCVIMPSAGDVAGAMFALLPGTGVDMLMGIGGTPEGIMAACAVKVLGGGMQTRLAPQRDDEREAIAAAGISTDEILDADDLVRGPRSSRPAASPAARCSARPAHRRLDLHPVADRPARLLPPDRGKHPRPEANSAGG